MQKQRIPDKFEAATAKQRWHKKDYSRFIFGGQQHSKAATWRDNFELIGDLLIGKHLPALTEEN